MYSQTNSSHTGLISRIKRLAPFHSFTKSEMKVSDVIELFNQEYNHLSITIDSHLRYEKDFSGEDSLSQGIRDPFSTTIYAKTLLGICERLSDRVGQYAVDSQNRKVEVHWIIISQILYPSSKGIQSRLKQELRNELSAHVLYGLWQHSTEPFGRFIRHYYEAVYQSPPEILSSITADELIRLFKTASQIADKLVSENNGNQESAKETSQKNPPASASEETAHAGFILATIAERFGLSDQFAVKRFVTRRIWLSVLLTLWLVLMLYLLMTTPVVIEIIETPLSSAAENYKYIDVIQLLLVPVAVLFAPVVLVLTAKQSVRKTCKRSFIMILQSLITSRIVTRQETYAFFTYRFGQQTARTLLKGL